MGQCTLPEVGTGDPLDPTQKGFAGGPRTCFAGACAPDIKTFCKDVSAGEGRVAACLDKRMKEQKQGNVAGERSAGSYAQLGSSSSRTHTM